MVDLKRNAARARSGAYKLGWGVRVVGPRRTLQGAARLAWLALRRPSEFEVRLQSGGLLAFRYPSQLAPSLVVFGDLIDPEYSFLRRIARDDWTVVDVGAAVGQFTVFAALLPCQVVHALEPSDVNLEMLNQNIALNGVGIGVVVHRVALSDTDGEAQFETSAKTYMSRLDRVNDGNPGSTVPLRRLDDLAPDIGLAHINVLKVNVAGFEASVLDGAENLLAAEAVDILVLLIGTSSMDWYAQLTKLSYRIGFYHPEEHAFYEITVVDARLLQARPWPARHLLAVHSSAVDRGVLGDMSIVPFLT